MLFTDIILIFCHSKPFVQITHAIFVPDFTNQQFLVLS